MSKHKMDAKKALQNYHAKEWTYDTCPGWIMDESTGVNYEKGIGQNEIIGFLFGFLAGCDHVEKANSEVIKKSFEEWAENFDIYKMNGRGNGGCSYNTLVSFAEPAWIAALAIGRKVGEDERDNLKELSIELKKSLVKTEAENKALRKDLDSVLRAFKTCDHWLSQLHKVECDQIRSKHFKDEALSEMGTRDE